MAGRPLGSLPGIRRGGRFDPISSRSYRPGDDPRLIDQRASARLATARGSDDLVVREHLAELAPSVVVVRDRTPSMSLFPAGTPWLRKSEAADAVVGLVEASARRTRSRCSVADGTPLRDVVRDRKLRTGSFVFVVSDFLVPVDDGAWLEGGARGLDLVPVVVQDPVWERSFPDVAGVVLPLADSAGSPVGPVRLAEAEVAARRQTNEARFASLIARFDALGVDPVVIDRSERDDIRARFVSWATARERGGRAC